MDGQEARYLFFDSGYNEFEVERMYSSKQRQIKLASKQNCPQNNHVRDQVQ